MNEAQMIVEAFRRLETGERAALATVVSIAGSSYRRPGARMLITESGETTGVLSVGCFEQDVCERAAQVMSTGQPMLVKYGTTSNYDIGWRRGLDCSGIINILIEPATNERIASLMQLLAECSESSTGGAIVTVFRVEGDVEATIGTSALMFPDGTVDGQFLSASIFDDLSEAVQLGAGVIKRYETADGYVDVFVEYVQPRVRLVVFGAGSDALPVIDLAAKLGWHTTVVDTRARASSLERFRKADAVLLCRPDDVMSQVSLFERSIVVVMTHNYLHDLEVLRQLLPMRLRYLAPIGLDIGAETPEEIALSVVSEIKAVLSDRTGAQLREREGSIHEQDYLVNLVNLRNPVQPTSRQSARQSLLVASKVTASAHAPVAHLYQQNQAAQAP